MKRNVNHEAEKLIAQTHRIHVEAIKNDINNLLKKYKEKGFTEAFYEAMDESYIQIKKERFETYWKTISDSLSDSSDELLSELDTLYESFSNQIWRDIKEQRKK